MPRALVVLFLLSLAQPARAHDDADWIMRGPFGWCCGPKDCFKVAAEDVVYEPPPKEGNGTYVVRWRGRVFHVPEKGALPSSPDRGHWVCEQKINGELSIRCLFVPPKGA